MFTLVEQQRLPFSARMDPREDSSESVRMLCGEIIPTVSAATDFPIVRLHHHTSNPAEN